MAYLLSTDFVARFGQAELDRVLVLADGRTFAACEADAASIIDSYLASVPGRSYLLPLTAPPARVIELCSDITRYKLWDDQAPEIVKDRYNAAIAFLEKVALGELTIVGLEEEPVEGVVGAIAYTAKDRVFTDETREGF